MKQQLLVSPLGAIGTCPQLRAGGGVEKVAEVNPGALHLCGDVALLPGRSKEMWSVATLALDFLVQADDGAMQGMALAYLLADWWKLSTGCIYITWEAVRSLISRAEAITSPVGIILAVLSLAIMRLSPSSSSGSARRWEAGLCLPTPRKHGSAHICH